MIINIIFTLFLIYILFKVFKFFYCIERVENSTVLLWSAQRLQKLNRDNIPFNPNGWFAVLESKELKFNQIKNVFAFGCDIVVYRSSSDKVTVLDAFCSHLGANLGIGGQVIGDSVKCPFHGWIFDSTGVCTHVPGIECSSLPKAKIKVWNSYEIYGIIFVWHHLNDEMPEWYPKSCQKLDKNKLNIRGKSENIFYAHIRDPLENAIDESHFDLVHNKHIPYLAIFLNYNKIFIFLLKHLNSSSKITYSFGTDLNKHISTIKLTTCANIFGYGGHIDSYFTLIGPGLFHMTHNMWNTNIYSIVTVTPIQNMKIKVIYRIYSGSSLREIILAKVYFLMFEKLFIQLDILIWNYKKQLSQSFFTKNDSGILEFRRWYRQFLCQINSMNE